MTFKIYLLLNIIICCEIINFKQETFSNPETVTNSVPLDQEKNMNPYKIKLLFLNNEILKISYSHFIKFQFLKDNFSDNDIIEGKVLNILSTYPKSVFKNLMYIFFEENIKKRHVLYANYDNIDHIIALSTVLEENSVTDDEIERIIANKEEALYLSSNIFERIKKNKVSLEFCLKLALVREFIVKFVYSFLLKSKDIIDELINNLNFFYKNKKLESCSTYIGRYTKFHTLQFVFSDNFSLHIMYYEENSTSLTVPGLRAGLYIIIIYKPVKGVSLNSYKQQIDFIIKIYKEKFRDDTNVFLSMHQTQENKKDRKFLKLLRTHYNFSEFITVLDLNLFRKRKDSINVFISKVGTKILGVKFEESTTLDPCDRKIEFISLSTSEILKKYLDK